MTKTKGLVNRDLYERGSVPAVSGWGWYEMLSKGEGQGTDPDILVGILAYGATAAFCVEKGPDQTYI